VVAAYSDIPQKYLCC